MAQAASVNVVAMNQGREIKIRPRFAQMLQRLTERGESAESVVARLITAERDRFAALVGGRDNQRSGASRVPLPGGGGGG
jgi:hypothetical protein